MDMFNVLLDNEYFEIIGDGINASDYNLMTRSHTRNGDMV